MKTKEIKFYIIFFLEVRWFRLVVDIVCRSYVACSETDKDIVVIIIMSTLGITRRRP